MLLLLSIALFFLVLAIPAIGTIREVMRPRDDGRLHIAEQYVRDPRWFGTAYRAKLAPFVAAAHDDAAYSANIELRTDEETRWAPDLTIEPGERVRGIAVGDRVHVGQGAGIRDAYGLEELDCDRDVIARTLTSNGTMTVGSAVNILRWIDADGAIDVGADTNLGVSASGGGRVTLADRVRFERVWGQPVSTRTAATQPLDLGGEIGAERIGQSDVLSSRPVIVGGHLRIARGTRIQGHVKANGAITVESGVRIEGNLIARGDITFAADVSVLGHVFSEGDIYLGPGSRIGQPGGVKTAYAAGRAYIANDVEVAGWLVAEDGGETL